MHGAYGFSVYFHIHQSVMGLRFVFRLTLLLKAFGIVFESLRFAFGGGIQSGFGLARKFFDVFQREVLQLFEIFALRIFAQQ